MHTNKDPTRSQNWRQGWIRYSNILKRNCFKPHGAPMLQTCEIYKWDKGHVGRDCEALLLKARSQHQGAWIDLERLLGLHRRPWNIGSPWIDQLPNSFSDFNFQDNFNDRRKLKVFSESHLQAYMAYTICTILGLSLLLRGLSGSLSSSRVASRGLVPHWMKSTRYGTSLAVSTRSISPRITVKQQKCVRPTTQSSGIAV